MMSYLIFTSNSYKLLVYKLDLPLYSDHFIADAQLNSSWSLSYFFADQYYSYTYSHFILKLFQLPNSYSIKSVTTTDCIAQLPHSKMFPYPIHTYIYSALNLLYTSAREFLSTSSIFKSIKYFKKN